MLSGLLKKRPTPLKVFQSLEAVTNSFLSISHGTSRSTEDLEEKNAAQELETQLTLVKHILFGEDSDHPPKPDEVNAMSRLLVDSPLLCETLIKPSTIKLVTFESRKRIVSIFVGMCNMNLSSFASDYLANNAEAVMFDLVSGYNDNDVALHSGSMIREVIRRPEMILEIFKPDFVLLDLFFTKYLVIEGAFEVTADAFATFTAFFHVHEKTLVLPFLDAHCQIFFEKYNKLLGEENYVTQRQSIKLLADILLDESYHAIMMKYTVDGGFLKSIMKLMRFKSDAIQIESFHVFKIFVCNPKKGEEVKKILGMNRIKLIGYLEDFQKDSKDEAFHSEKKQLIQKLQEEFQDIETTSSNSVENKNRIESDHTSKEQEKINEKEQEKQDVVE